MNPIQTIIKRFRDLPIRQQVVLVGGIIAVLVTVFILYSLINQTSWTTVATGLNPADTSKVATSLTDAGVQNNITQGGTAIQVPADQADKARATVATSPSAQGGTVGFEIFDKNNLGATDLQQQVQYQRALEGEITRTITQIQGVNGAQVQLVLAKDQMFTDQGTSASASVILETATPLSPGQVAGVSHLVQGAVPGLQPQNITITDQSGNMLWPNGSGGAGGGGDSKTAAQNTYNQQLALKLTTLLNQTVGVGKGQVQVSSDLNMDKVGQEKLTYGPKSYVQTDATQNESLQSTNGGAAGAAGTNANIPTFGTGGSTGGSTRYTNKKNGLGYAVDKTVTKTDVAQGAVNKLQVAVVLDQSIPAATAASLRQALTAAAGIQPARGDQLTLSQVQFAAQTKPSGPGPIQTYGGYIKYVLLGIALLLFLILTRRGLKRREGTELSLKPTWVDDLEKGDTARSAVAPKRTKANSQSQVEKMIDDDPEQMAMQVKEWMNNE